jgi:predicted TIM-barrel fold metal-dependent hydrolase
MSAGMRFDRPKDVWTTRPLWEEVPEAAYEPHAMLRALDEDGVWGAVIQPTQGFMWFMLEDLELVSEICRASNDFIADFCAVAPDRLKGVAVINVRDVDAAVMEFERCAARGIAAAFVPIWPEGDERYDDPRFDPIFAAAHETGIPLLLHIGAMGPNIEGCTFSPNLSRPERQTVPLPAERATMDYWIRHSLACMLFSGVFDRYPGVKVGTVEHELAWIPHWLAQMDFVYVERPAMLRGWKSKDGLLPSDYWRRHMFGTFMEDEIGVRLRDVIGVENILWGNDFPHAESTWPRSGAFLERIFADVPLVEQQMMICRNAQRLYGFDVPE